jgi:hypothetical protein
LPFDLKHRRWPLSFSLSPDATPEQRKETKTVLIKDLEDAIRGIAELLPGHRAAGLENRLDALESLVAAMSGSIAHIPEIRSAVDRIQKVVVPAEEDRNSPENRAQNALTNLVTRVQGGDFEGINYAQGMLGLVVLPVNQPPGSLPLFSKENQIRLKLKTLYFSGWDHRRHGTRLVTFSTWGDRVDAVSEITDDSIISAAGHEVISINRQYLQNMNIPENIHVIPSMAFENSIVEAVHEYIGLLLEFGVVGPWIVSISLFNLQTSILYVGPRFSFDGRPFSGYSITPPPILVPADTNINNPQSVAQVLRRAFDFVWREHNFPQSLNYGASGDWTRT